MRLFTKPLTSPLIKIAMSPSVEAHGSYRRLLVAEDGRSGGGGLCREIVDDLERMCQLCGFLQHDRC
jgi:hypothetical protein